MSEEISRILKMVEEGKISSDKAAELIGALNSKNEITEGYAESNLDKMLKVKVNSQDGDKVNVNVPIKFVKAVLKSCGKIPMMNDKMKGMESIDIQMIADAIDNNLSGKIVDVHSEDGDIVEIIIE